MHHCISVLLSIHVLGRVVGFGWWSVRLKRGARQGSEAPPADIPNTSETSGKCGSLTFPFVGARFRPYMALVLTGYGVDLEGLRDLRLVLIGGVGYV